MAERITNERLKELIGDLEVIEKTHPDPYRDVKHALSELLAYRESGALEGMRIARRFVEDEQRCREASFLPKPTADEESSLQQCAGALYAIDTAIERLEAIGE